MAEQKPVEPATSAWEKCVACGEQAVLCKEPTLYPFQHPRGRSSGPVNFRCEICGAVNCYEFFDESLLASWRAEMRNCLRRLRNWRRRSSFHDPRVHLDIPCPECGGRLMNWANVMRTGLEMDGEDVPPDAFPSFPTDCVDCKAMIFTPSDSAGEASEEAEGAQPPVWRPRPCSPRIH
ncbi:MAG: hypothetical protein ACK5JT_04855 [Hyphomicrobiaceae bacterium]